MHLIILPCSCFCLYKQSYWYFSTNYKWSIWGRLQEIQSTNGLEVNASPLHSLVVIKTDRALTPSITLMDSLIIVCTFFLISVHPQDSKFGLYGMMIWIEIYQPGPNPINKGYDSKFQHIINLHTLLAHYRESWSTDQYHKALIDPIKGF